MEGCGVTESYLRVDCKMQHLHNHQCLQGNVLNISLLSVLYIFACAFVGMDLNSSHLTYKLVCQVMLCCLPSFIIGLTSLRDDPMTIDYRAARLDLIYMKHRRGVCLLCKPFHLMT